MWAKTPETVPKIQKNSSNPGQTVAPIAGFCEECSIRLEIWYHPQIPNDAGASLPVKWVCDPFASPVPSKSTCGSFHSYPEYVDPHPPASFLPLKLGELRAIAVSLGCLTAVPRDPAALRNKRKDAKAQGKPCILWPLGAIDRVRRNPDQKH
jgi:hypothetical protein